MCGSLDGVLQKKCIPSRIKFARIAIPIGSLGLRSFLSKEATAFAPRVRIKSTHPASSATICAENAHPDFSPGAEGPTSSTKRDTERLE
jgi:hypothetical protein